MRLVLLIFLLCPGVALADPATLVALTTALSSTAFTIGTIAVSWGSVIFTAGSLLYGAAAQRKQKKALANAAREQRDSFNAGLNDRTISGVATEFPERFVYGTARVGANVVAIFTSGSRDEYKHIVGVFAQGESEAIDESYINGQALGSLDIDNGPTSGPFVRVTTDSRLVTAASQPFNLFDEPDGGTLQVFGTAPAESYPPAGNLSNYSKSGLTITIEPTLINPVEPAYYANLDAPYHATYQKTTSTPMVRFSKHLGTPTDPVDAGLAAAVPGQWPATAVLRGHTYGVLTLNLNQPEFQGGLPQFETIIRGRKLYDPRTGLTVWSDNPALVAYDYLTSEMGGVKPASIPLASVIAAANDCDDIVTTGNWTGKRYTFNGTITSDQPREEVLERIAQSMAGGIDATTLVMFAGKYSAPVMALTQADIVGEIAISPGLPLNEIFNTVKGQFIGAENAYVATDYRPYVNAAYLAVDGEELDTNVDLPYTNSQQRCTNLARIFTESNRNGYTIVGRFSLKVWSVQVGQRVTFTAPFFLGGLTKTFRVTDKSFAPDKVGVVLGLKEDAESIYDLADETQADATPNSGLGNPFVVEKLASLTCESGDAQLLRLGSGDIVSRILASWPQSTTQGVLQKGYIEVEFQETTQAEWQKVEVDGVETSAYLSPVEDGKYYNVRARGVNPYVSAKGDWVYATVHRVIGKLAPPPDVLSFAVDFAGVATWPTMVGVPDLAGYQIRWQPGNNRSWGDATPLHSGLLPASPYTIQIRPTVTATFMLKAFDTSQSVEKPLGNESVNAAVSVINLGDPVVANVVRTVDYRALGWPGTYTGATVVGGDLVATADASPLAWDPNPATAGWTLDTDPGWTLATYGAVVYQPEVFTVDPEDSGAQLTLPNEITGTAYLIEYRRDGDALAWTADAEPGWTDDAALGWTVEAYRPWPGTVVAQTGRYEWQVTIQSRDVPGVIAQLTPTLDVLDQFENVGRVSILAAGTVIPTTKTWRHVDIGLTLVADGGTAETTRIEDEATRTVTTRNAANVGVDGTVLATLQGY